MPALGGPPVAEGGDEAELLGQALVKHPPKNKETLIQRILNLSS